MGEVEVRGMDWRGDGNGEVVIIGAGLAGTLLAISLHRLSIPVRIYESRSVDAPELASGVVLTPNGLQILRKLGVYERISPLCWKNGYRTYKNEHDETTSRVLVADDSLYGFMNHRLYRRLLLSTLKDILDEIGVRVEHNSRFDGVMQEDSGGVVFKVNGIEQRASLLVGADGVYSSVRKYFDQDTRPEYTGTVGVLSHIRWDDVDWPYPEFERQCTIQGKPGAFFMIPEVQDGSEVMVGTQVKYPDMSRQEWEAMAKDTEVMAGFFQRRYDEWHDTAKKIIDAVCLEQNKAKLYFWPFLRMPRLRSWFSSSGKVLIVGDAAHALPPSSAQGVNQALEDVWSLSLLMNTKSERTWLQRLEYWQKLRQNRIETIFEWATNSMNVQRMSREERMKLIQEGKVKDPGDAEFDDMRWLYVSNAEEEIQKWLEENP